MPNWRIYDITLLEAYNHNNNDVADMYFIVVFIVVSTLSNWTNGTKWDLFSTR